MRQTVNLIRQLLDESTDQDRAEWKGHAETILAAISNSHPTRRGVQAGIAAAFFENIVLNDVVRDGWICQTAPARKTALSFIVGNNGRTARILIATLQLEGGRPKRAQSHGEQGPVYLARLPEKTARRRENHRGSRIELGSPQREGVSTRTYSFGDFDVLAVSIQPLTRGWSDFRYSLARTLTASREHATLIARTQEVPTTRSRFWTSHLSACLDWHLGRTAENPVPGGTVTKSG